MKNKFESVSNTGDDLLQMVYNCKQSGEKFKREIQNAPEGIEVISSACKSKVLQDFAPSHPGVLQKCFQ